MYHQVRNSSIVYNPYILSVYCIPNPRLQGALQNWMRDHKQGQLYWGTGIKKNSVLLPIRISRCSKRSAQFFGFFFWQKEPSSLFSSATSALRKTLLPHIEDGTNHIHKSKGQFQRGTKSVPKAGMWSSHSKQGSREQNPPRRRASPRLSVYKSMGQDSMHPSILKELADVARPLPTFEESQAKSLVTGKREPLLPLVGKRKRQVWWSTAC